MAVAASLTELILSEGARGVGPLIREVLPGTDPSTAFRWATKGVSRPDGTRLRLEVIRVGGRLLTSRARVLAFLEAQQADPAAAGAGSAVRPPASRERESAAAEKTLIEMGC